MAKRVLLAEDEPNIAESLTFLLDRAGFEVTVETDGRGALTSALDAPPDVLILDVMLPEVDGYEVLRQLRADRRAQGLPIVMLTAKGQAKDRERAEALGVNRFMTKPFSNQALLETVRALGRVG